jgi:DNA-binding CsgD family transcriptional regulator
VKRRPALENLTAAIVERCRAGLAPERLRDGVLSRLQRAVPFDAAFWATVDPATLLFTQPHQHQIPPETAPYFMRNEFFDEDVNRWTTLARNRAGVRSLVEVTAGELEKSPRFRDIFKPLGLGDELRAVFRVGGICWGCMCLHREAGSAFSKQEAEYVQRLAPHTGEGIRAGLLVSSLELPQIADAPGLVILTREGSISSATDTGRQWLEELGYLDVQHNSPPGALQVLTALLDGPGDIEQQLPRLRMRTPAGRWVVLHGSTLPTDEGDAIAVIIEEASPADLAPILMMAYGLTDQERVVTSLVCQGLSTREIAGTLHITDNTVQDHLKSIFEKTGVRSRRELSACLLQQQYVPRTMAQIPVGPSGFFVE